MQATSTVLKFIDEQGDNIITAVAYDYYGRRLASVSADGVIRIRDLDDNGVWCVEEGCEIKFAHLGTLWRVDWAHPGFGKQLLATCSQDRTVKIWEENNEAAPGSDRSGLPRGMPRWTSVATLNESRYGVVDVKFAPRHLELRLASASEDGVVRVYRAPDPSSVGAWKLESSFSPCPEGSGVTSLSWCPSPFLRPLMVVGTASGLVQIWVSKGTTEDLGKWVKVDVELPEHSKTRGVSSVDWSPQFSTLTDRIATCGGDGRLHVHRLERQGLAEEAWGDTQTVKLKGDKGEAEGVAWTAEWDISGSYLSSTDGSTCRTWVLDEDGINWFCTDTFQELGGGGMISGGGGGMSRKAMMMANRQDDDAAAAAVAPASASSVATPPPPATVTTGTVTLGGAGASITGLELD